ncbi:phosphoribosylglycinamide formyltransferase [Lacticaseibacillus casei]|jgi:phosphoribosylglycinamide formyltransferase-1|uniref:Phosphoribosylglycinamide formyltransferase n=1 Tax=Lacticaseibacillus huelsenbergensis TaxID=3035291 RepID=A0ABY8DQE5_9LACO|nr:MULTISPECIES: phosphoribosylglycinamide formyltransferase [Lacticaseibacillus]MDG3060510.1 phosphoribosylglycinamide formyltransferase [Lacticaseibacillus sp. BCRC 81376]QVI37533.1 phosphoribosylglycinamide formyltransferase [Lacticaseibacillus casei]QXG59320.1 phosphoribosylglycinamide formyltransferase [Lacticaseibacillus casei]WFB39221.1 phosphoribosylglycinamide formyltransferase [Lacticaseibacillus huelsenbergensis]WFB40923.1 phosphoribosylglycinamide formyltransferase [Lacticaseibacil
MKALAVFASGNGTNFEALFEASQAQDSNFRIVVVVCDRARAPVIRKAAHHQIPTIVVNFKDYADKAAAEAHILTALPPVDALILAGYMRIIGPTLLDAFPRRIINLHPALLPSFPGRQGIKDAFDYGVKVTGVTVHYVDAGIDTGEIIAQDPVRVLPGMTLAELEAAIHRQEHHTFPETVKKLIQEGAI